MSGHMKDYGHLFNIEHLHSRWMSFKFLQHCILFDCDVAPGRFRETFGWIRKEVTVALLDFRLEPMLKQILKTSLRLTAAGQTLLSTKASLARRITSRERRQGVGFAGM